jgi:hypothetical protein
VRLVPTQQLWARSAEPATLRDWGSYLLIAWCLRHKALIGPAVSAEVGESLRVGLPRRPGAASSSPSPSARKNAGEPGCQLGDRARGDGRDDRRPAAMSVWSFWQAAVRSAEVG